MNEFNIGIVNLDNITGDRTMMNYQNALQVAIETLEYIKKNNPSYFNEDKDYIAKTQLALSDIKDNCKIVKNLPFILDNR